MNLTVSKGLKPFIFKVIIVLMSLLYVFGPVHEEINKLLHTVSHSLEMPNNILSHKDTANTLLRTDVHISDHHKNIDEHHEHKVITFLDKILEGSDQNNTPSDVHIVTHKIDKHINNYKSEFTDDSPILFPLETRHCFSEKKNSVCKGYLKDFREPPRV